MSDFNWDELPDATPQKGFNWDELPDAKTPNKPIQDTSLTSALHGAEQGATLGFSDEIRGALGAAKDVAMDDRYKLNDLVARYQVNRDQARAMLEKSKRDNPLSYTTGEVGGSTALSFVPGLGVAAKGASLAGRALAAAGTGAALGAASGLGQSNADLTKGNFQGALNDTQSGAITGGIAGGVLTPLGETVGSGIKNFIDPEHLRGIAADRAVKATTGQNISALRKLAGATSSGQDFGRTEESIRKAGRDIIDSGVIGATDRVEDLAPKLAAKRQEIGSQIGDVGKKVDELYPRAVSGDKIADQLLDYAATIPATGQGKLLQEKILNEAENLKAMGGLSFADAQKVKNQFKFKPQDQDALISNQDVTNKIRNLISKEMDNTAADVASKADLSGKELLDQYGKLKGQYRTFKGAADAAGDRALKNLSNRYVSPSDYGVGATGALAGTIASGGSAIPAIALGAAGAGLNKLARERGSSAAAVGFMKAAQALEDSPEFAKKFGNILNDAAQRGGGALAVTHQLLSQKYPEYQRLLDQQNGQ